MLRQNINQEDSLNYHNTQLKIATDAVVVIHANLRGKITIGASTIIHPKAKINAGKGEIIFGTHNIVEETAIIENLSENGSVLEIGNDNLFEIGSICQASKIGNNNVFGIKSFVGQKVEITDGCKIGAKCKILVQGPLPPQTIVYFEQNLRKFNTEKPSNQRNQTEFLKKLMPKYSNIIQNSIKN